jgi:hypothetical protein
MPVIACIQCNKEVERKPSDIKRGGGKYCSKACHIEAQRELKKQKEEKKNATRN